MRHSPTEIALANASYNHITSFYISSSYIPAQRAGTFASYTISCKEKAKRALSSTSILYCVIITNDATLILLLYNRAVTCL